jgi:sugar phosphate isomerase/epimerase
MEFGISTHWNANRHADGAAMIDEVLEMGFRRVELGYDLHRYHTEGVAKRVEEGAVIVDSVHNFCPVPPEAPHGHPELYTLGALDWRIHEAAVINTTETIRYASSVGAKIVVMHCGNVFMRNLTSKLIKMCQQGNRFTNAYERTKLKMLLRREKKVGQHLDSLFRGLERLVPVCAEHKLRLAIEILPTWESIPTEPEIKPIIDRFGLEHLCYWHDIGHAQIRENLGLSNHRQALFDAADYLGGFHVHDVKPPAEDHCMPPKGMIEFPAFKEVAERDVLRVLEPRSKVTPDEIKRGLAIIRDSWMEPVEDDESDEPVAKNELRNS